VPEPSTQTEVVLETLQATYLYNVLMSIVGILCLERDGPQWPSLDTGSSHAHSKDGLTHFFNSLFHAKVSKQGFSNIEAL
jgi:hypothetical protein